MFIESTQFVMHHEGHLACKLQFPAVLTISAAQTFGDLGYWHQRADERHGKPPPR